METTMTHERELEIIKELARQYSTSIVEVCEIARAFILADMGGDPLKQPKGETFVFRNKPNYVEQLKPGEEIDFWWFRREVPLPDAKCDLLVALSEFKRDSEHIANLLKYDADKLSIERLVAISTNRLLWFRFLAARHPNATARTVFTKLAAELEALTEKNRARAREMLRKRGVISLNDQPRIN
jgi:hypothetical protein